MVKKIRHLIVILIIVGGIVLVCYLSFASFINQQFANREIADYQNEMKDSSEEELEKTMQLAYEYNATLPVGGSGTHAVLSAHTGMASKKLFTDLNLVKEGDIFFIHVLNQNFAYQVDQIKVVLPEDTDDLYIEEGKDYVTLLTCTPFGINDHRLLVRGERIDYDFSKNDMIAVTPKVVVDNYLWAYVTGITVVLILFIGFWKKKRSGRNKKTE